MSSLFREKQMSYPIFWEWANVRGGGAFVREEEGNCPFHIVRRTVQITTILFHPNDNHLDYVYLDYLHYLQYHYQLS